LLEANGVGLGGRLADTTLSLQAGELTCLVGPNGSGKTSLLHALAGIGHPSGSVRIEGIDPQSLPPRQRQRLFSYLPASREAAWPLSARDLVALGGAGARDEERISQLLADLDLTDFANRRIDRMSTGERSRVLIARALAANPRALLLDEPAANLDPYWQLRMMDYLRASTRDRGQGMLVAVHDLELARDYADRLIVMDAGRIEADGEPAALLAGDCIPRIFKIRQTDGRWRAV
jgi:iron complex transport system ATP-binding protein